MRLPFTETQFLDVFGAYNSALWPVVAILWVTTLGLSVALVRHRANRVALSAFAAFHWAWSGIAYHAFFFTAINPAAWAFAVLFVAQAVGFLWLGFSRRHLVFDVSHGPRRIAAVVFIAYSLMYPLLVVLSGHDIPRAPVFAVPCPTTLFTAGLLFAIGPVPRWLFVVPIAWSLVGGSAALVLGMTPDLMLLAAGACMAAYAVSPATFGGSGVAV